jgi:hypothetical protein
MASVVFTGADVISRQMAKTMQMTIQEVADLTYDTAADNTPVKTGYTRSQWTQRVRKTDFEVANRVPWIERLEAGASRQAPKGIIGPTLTEVKGKIK